MGGQLYYIAFKEKLQIAVQMKWILNVQFRWVLLPEKQINLHFTFSQFDVRFLYRRTRSVCSTISTLVYVDVISLTETTDHHPYSHTSKLIKCGGNNRMIETKRRVVRIHTYLITPTLKSFVVGMDCRSSRRTWLDLDCIAAKWITKNAKYVYYPPLLGGLFPIEWLVA